MKFSNQCVTALVSFAIAAAALHSSAQPPVRPPKRVSGSIVIRPGATPASQIVIPRLYSKGQYPSGKLLGTGPECVVVATAETLTRKIPYLIITQDAGRPKAEWQGGSTNTTLAPAVVQPRIVDLTICGHDDSGQNYANTANALVHEDQALNHGKPDLYGLLRVEATGAIVRDVNLFYAPGTAAYFSRPSAPRNGPTLPFDRIELQISGLSAKRCYRGINNEAIDSSLTDCSVSGFRDYGIRMAGACLYSKLHVYGGTGKDEAIGVIIDGDANIGTTIYSENCKTGIKVTGKYNSIVGLYIHTCEVQAALVPGALNEFSSIRIQDCPLGFVIDDQRNKITTGSMTVPAGGIGVRFNSGLAQTIRDVSFHLADNATGIEAKAPLQDCTIVAQFSGGNVGLDLNDNGQSRLGSGNTIIISAERTKTPIDLPPNWNAQSNQIYLNGQRLNPR